MTSALLCADEGAADLEKDLAAAGMQVTVCEPEAPLLREVLRLAPGLLVLRHRHPAATLLPALAALRQHAPLPVLLFTADGETDTLAAALESGVDAFVVNGYAPHRLRGLIQLARLRFERDQRVRTELHSLAERFEERKLVDRAKGILMGAGQLQEEEAFRLLRVGSMRLKQRVGQVSQLVIEAAHGAQAINRAGVLRMLSQRVVLQRALAWAGVEPQRAGVELKAALGRADANLRELDRLLSASTYGDLRTLAQQDWQALAVAAGSASARVDAASLASLDRRAEACLQSADRLVAALEGTGFGGEPHIVNLCGRQRMLGERLAKQSLLQALSSPPGAEPGTSIAAIVSEFERALDLLRAAPLGDAELRRRLEVGAQHWAALRRATQSLGDAAGRQALAVASENLLAVFEDLTSRYERSLDLLIG